MTSNEVAVKAEAGALVQVDSTYVAPTYAQEELTRPFIRIIATNSPEAMEKHAKYIEGAKPGMFFNTATKELYDGEKGLRVVRFAKQYGFIEWVPKDNGGGFVREYSPAEGSRIITDRDANGRDIIQTGSPFGKPGNQLQETFTNDVLVINEDGSFFPAIVSMSGSARRVAKAWNNTAANARVVQGGRQVPAPLCFSVYKLGTKFEQNDKNSWFNFTIDRVGGTVALLTDEFFQAALKEELNLRGAARTIVNDSVKSTDDLTDDEIPF